MTEAASVPPVVTLFALGGTIAAPVDVAAGGSTIALAADALVGDLGERAGVRVDARSFRQLPSASLTLDDIVELAAAIDDEAGSVGFVVTVGTDALEEVAFALDLLGGVDSPVVVTGAMRNAGTPGADGAANLLASIRVAASDAARGQGALVVLGDEIHLARYAAKSHSSSPSTFESRNVGPIGWIVEGRVRIPLVRRERPRPVVVGSVPRVGLVRASLGDDLSAVTGDGCAGLVLEAFGAGHVPEAAVPALAAVAARIPVVFVSRTGAGDVYLSSGAFPGSERDLLEAGLIPGGAFDGPKARVLLSLLLGAGATREEIVERFAVG